MPFDAFLQFVEPGTNPPKVVGEDVAPPQVPPSAVQEIPGDIQAAAAQASPSTAELQQDTQKVEGTSEISSSAVPGDIHAVAAQTSPSTAELQDTQKEKSEISSSAVEPQNVQRPRISGSR